MEFKNREKELIKNAIKTRISEIKTTINTKSYILNASHHLKDWYKDAKRKSIQENQELIEEYERILDKLKKEINMELKLYSGIEFRAFIKYGYTKEDLNNPDMLDEIKETGLGFIDTPDIIDFKNNRIKYDSDWYEEERFKLMQFTGMQDKTGQKIFEGYILEFDESITKDGKKHRFAVSKIKGAFCISSDKVQGISSVFDKATNDNVMTLFELFENYNEDLTVDELDYAEVVGNIYENSDMELF